MCFALPNSTTPSSAITDRWQFDAVNQERLIDWLVFGLAPQTWSTAAHRWRRRAAAEQSHSSIFSHSKFLAPKSTSSLPTLKAPFGAIPHIAVRFCFRPSTPGFSLSNDTAHALIVLVFRSCSCKVKGEGSPCWIDGLGISDNWSSSG